MSVEHDSCGENQLLSDGIRGQLQRKRFKSRTPGQKLEVRPQALGEKPLLLLGYMGMLQSNCLLNISVYTHKSALLSSLVRGASLCSVVVSAETHGWSKCYIK